MKNNHIDISEWKVNNNVEDVEGAVVVLKVDNNEELPLVVQRGSHEEVFA